MAFSTRMYYKFIMWTNGKLTAALVAQIRLGRTINHQEQFVVG
jgi:hypothetical protein